MVRRELEGLSFLALVLRPHESEKSADLMYADDANIERDVPFEELCLVREREAISEALTEENLQRFCLCLEELRREEAELLRFVAQEPANLGENQSNASPIAKGTWNGVALMGSAGLELIPDEEGKIHCPDGTTILTHGEDQDQNSSVYGDEEESPARMTRGVSLSPVKGKRSQTLGTLPCALDQASSAAASLSTTASSTSSEGEDEAPGGCADSGGGSPPDAKKEDHLVGSSGSSPGGFGSAAQHRRKQGRACGGGVRGIRALRGRGEGLGEEEEEGAGLLKCA